MSKKFAWFVITYTIGVLIIFPYDNPTLPKLLKMIVGATFIAGAGALRWKDLEDIYEGRV